jgi:hypothetical protein
MNSGFKDFQDLINVSSTGQDIDAITNEITVLQNSVDSNTTAIGVINLEITALQDSVDYNNSAIISNTLNIGINSGNIATTILGLASEIQRATAAEGINSVDILNNATGISTNTTNISNNTTNIGANSTQIGLNQFDIASNSTGIINIQNSYLKKDGTISMSGNLNLGSNAITNVSLVNGEDITTMAIDLTTNSSNIATNATDIASNTYNLGLAQGNITQNATDIVTNQNSIYTNSLGITSAQGNITQNATDIVTNQNSIYTNSLGITSAQGNITQNATNITTNQNSIYTNSLGITSAQGNITQNATDILNNESLINGNYGLILNNESDINALQSGKVSKSGDTISGDLNITGNTTVNSEFRIDTDNKLNLGYNVTKESNAGVLAYKRFSSSVDIVGAGLTGGGDRQIKIWEDLTLKAVIQTSDERLKHHIRPIEMQMAGDLIDRLEPKCYMWRPIDTITGEETEFNDHHCYMGLIAQEVKDVQDDIGDSMGEKLRISRNAKSETDYMSVSYTQLIAPMIKVIQDLRTRVEKLEQKAL